MSENKAPGQIYAYDIHNTHYPYVNIKQDSQTQLLASFRRSIASINPFSYRQVPSQDRAAFGLRWGNAWYAPNPYPNGIHFDRVFPTHYDPLAETNRTKANLQLIKYAPGNYSTLVVTSEKLPRPCVRTIQNYRRCQMVNGTEKCNSEAQDILAICPNWALDHMKEKVRFYTKALAINNQTYLRAMQVEDYNKGRTTADVAPKTWIHGTRQHLRPDTMWADDRYTNITQSEINEAIKRVEARKAREASHEKKQAEQVNVNANTGEQPVRVEKSLYP
ncbi:hypothetical protein ABPG74_019481 [Tetrahymena malaccensis]